MAETRQKIIEHAAKLLEFQGYHATSLDDIVEGSGTPRGSLYYYFPAGKEELAAEAVADSARRMNRNIDRMLEAESDPVEAIYRFALSLESYLEATDCAGGAPLATVTLEAPATSQRLRQACERAYEDLRQPFEQTLKDGGYPNAEGARYSTLITAALEGAIILARAQNSAAPIRDVAEAIKVLLECTRQKG